MAVADLDRDGFQDVVFASRTRNTLTVALGASLSTFVAGPQAPGTGREPVAILAEDLNDNGIVDIITADATDGTISIFINDGSANLTALSRLVIGGEPYALAMIGQRIAVADRINSRVVLLRKTGDGRLQVDGTAPTGIEPIAIGVADFNNDGTLDILTANDIGRDVTLLLGTGTGFEAPRHFPLGGVPGALTLGDFDIDGFTDFAVTLPLVDQIAVYRRTPQGQFIRAFDAPVPGGPSAILLADDQRVRVSGDGFPDMLVVSERAATVTLFQGRAPETVPPFVETSRFATSKGAIAFAATEIDRDPGAFADLVIAGRDVGRFMVLRGRGAGSYIGAVTFTTDLGPAAVALGDFDGDRLTDIVTANQAGNTVSFLKGNGLGNVRKVADIPVLVAPSLMVAGELTGDSQPDLLIASEVNATAAIYRGDGAGGFTGVREIFLAGGPAAVALGDIDGNGQMDAAIADIENSAVDLFVNLRASGFPAFVLEASGPPTDVALGDVNNDGLVDVVATVPSNEHLNVWFQLQDGRFSNRTSFSTGGPGTRIALADFDGDGQIDVMVANHSTSSLNLLTGDRGGFRAPRRFGLDDPPIAIIAADFNLDGAPDIGVLSDMAGRVTMLGGDGSGNFPRRTVFATGVEPLSFAVGQVNNEVGRGDNLPDLVVGDYLADRVTILRNITSVAQATPTVRPTSTPRALEQQASSGGCHVEPDASREVLLVLLLAAVAALLARYSGRRA